MKCPKSSVSTARMMIGLTKTPGRVGTSAVWQGTNFHTLVGPGYLSRVVAATERAIKAVRTKDLELNTSR